METYAGIDLHSSNNFIGVINNKDQRLYGKRHSNRLTDVLTALAPFKESLIGVVVESTFNWYWLADGLQEDTGFIWLIRQPLSNMRGLSTPMTNGIRFGWRICTV